MCAVLIPSSQKTYCKNRKYIKKNDGTIKAIYLKVSVCFNILVSLEKRQLRRSKISGMQKADSQMIVNCFSKFTKKVTPS